VVRKHEHDKLIRETLLPDGEKFVADLDKMLKEVVQEGNADAAIYIGVAREHGLLARIYAKIPIGRGIESYGDKTKEQFHEIALALTALGGTLKSDEERRLFVELNQRLEKYEAGFDKVHKDELAIQELIDGEMKETADQIIEDGEWLKKAAAAAETENRDETVALIGAAETLMLVIGVAGLAVGLVMAWLTGNGVSRPVISMTAAMRDLAGGNKAVEIPARGRADEIGEMAQAVQVFKDNMIKVEQQAIEQEEADCRAKEQRRQAMLDMADSFEASVQGVVEAVASGSTEMRTTAQSMAATAEETGRQATAAAAGVERASSNVQTVASASEELASSIAEVARQVADSADVAKGAVSQAERTNGEVGSLVEAARKIGKVVKLISDIAERTNLLALNATIEAARAGNAGKGFAVVAGEVKSLANQTAKATEEISAQIGAIQDATGNAVAAIKGIAETIAKVDEIAATIASAVEEQGAATQEIARNAQECAQGVAEVSGNVGGVDQAATETGTASGQVLTSAEAMSEQASNLRDEVEKFLAEVRAA
jgi:methyl-accepting chemotaxis protein